jgi:uncharacterized membrane protein (DUF106 family)
LSREEFYGILALAIVVGFALTTYLQHLGVGKYEMRRVRSEDKTTEREDEGHTNMRSVSWMEKLHLRK